MAGVTTMLMHLALLIIALSLDFTVAQIGVAYGRNGDNLPPPSRVVELYNQYNIQRMRIYDTDPDTLKALQDSKSNIEVTVGILNPDLQPLAENPDNANTWVRDHIMNYPDVKFRHVVVGNEVRPGNPNTEQYASFVLPAMRNINNALSSLQRGNIKVTTNVDTEVIEPSSNFPPENGRFSDQVAPYLDPIVRFLVDTDAPLFASIYPYFAYLSNPTQIDPRYALLDPTFPGVVTQSGTTYKNLFYALLDAVNAALEKSVASMSFELAAPDADQKQPPEVKTSESGHSSQGGSPPPGKLASTNAAGDDFANIENARAYVNNLIQAVKTGTPRRPGQPIETYIFAMFDENQKPGGEDEKHFGLFTPAGEPKYQVNFN